MGSRYIVAIVRSEVLTTLEQRLQHAGVRGLSVTKVKGIGEYANFFARDQFSEHAKIEIFTDESKVEAIHGRIQGRGDRQSHHRCCTYRRSGRWNRDGLAGGKILSHPYPV